MRLAAVIVTGVVSRRAVRPLADEAERRLPADEAVPGRRVRWTHGITIHARPSEIWPWLRQMGCGRAGWYSCDALDNGGVPSADRIVTEFQQPEVSTRLLTRSTGSSKHFIVGLLLELLLRPIHFGMQRRQLLNLKRDSEGRRKVTSRDKTEASTLKLLVGSGDKIGLFTLPFLLVGLALNFAYPAAFHVGGPSTALRVISGVTLIAGVTIWIWSVVLILTRVPSGELITNGPYRLVKHPLYTGVAPLVLPWVGFLLDTWLGALVGIVLYLASRRFAPEEEAELSETFGPAWDDYRRTVMIPWL